MTDITNIFLAPNGKPSRLTPEQYRIVRTPAFKEWFGDWERLANVIIKDPAIDEITLGNISKDVSNIRDENGEPLVVYHGTDENFTEFDYDRSHGGFFFSDEKSDAENFMIHMRSVREPIIIEAFLNIKNPKQINSWSEYQDVELNNYGNTKTLTRDDVDNFIYSGGNKLYWDYKENVKRRISELVDKHKLVKVKGRRPYNKLVGYDPELYELMKSEGFDHYDKEFVEGRMNYKDAMLYLNKYNEYVHRVYDKNPEAKKGMYAEEWVKEFDSYKYITEKEADEIYQKTKDDYEEKVIKILDEINIGVVRNVRVYMNQMFVKEGFDGIFIPDKQWVTFYSGDNDYLESNGNQYVAFNSNQIKLADGTNITFDGGNPDIRFNDGGGINKRSNYYSYFNTDLGKNVIVENGVEKILVNGGLIPTLESISEQDKKYINSLLEYVYYNNPEEDDEFAPNDAPDWIIKGSYQYLKDKGVSKIYRGVGKGSYEDEDAYSWTYNKEVAEGFGKKIIDNNLPENIISVEFIFDWVQKNKYIPEGATEGFVDYINNFEGGEEEVILAQEKLADGGELSIGKKVIYRDLYKGYEYNYKGEKFVVWKGNDYGKADWYIGGEFLEDNAGERELSTDFRSRFSAIQSAKYNINKILERDFISRPEKEMGGELSVELVKTFYVKHENGKEYLSFDGHSQWGYKDVFKVFQKATESDVDFKYANTIGEFMYSETYMKKIISIYFNQVSFKKFGNLFRKYINKYFSQEFNQQRLNSGIIWSELAGYIIGDGDYYIENQSSFIDFCKEAKIKLPPYPDSEKLVFGGMVNKKELSK